MKKKILLSLATIVVVAGGVAVLSAFEAHVINVTAHIENALNIDTYGVDFGTVFPQESLLGDFTIRLSDSFMGEDRADDVRYNLVQKPKPWTLNFGGIPDVDTHNRSLVFVDPDPGKGEGYAISAGKLTITTGNDVEDLFGPNEIAGNWSAPRMVIPMGGNFTIETKVTASPNSYPPDPYQSGGILVYGSDGNVVRLELTGFSGLGGSAVYMESQKSGVKVGKGWNSLGLANPATVYLKLSRNGNVFTGEYSVDGTVWNPVTTQEGNFDNADVGNQPKVGLAVVDNKDGSQFSADFEYVTFNGGYLNLCPFLSKTKDPAEDEENNDVEEPSYFNGNGCQAQTVQASGYLSKNGEDTTDKWFVDLKVPPVAGYVGQDWPASCSPFVVQEDEMDYGCDIWVEVTGISETEEVERPTVGANLVAYIPPACNEGNTVLVGNSIQAKIDSASDGGVVCVGDGTHNVDNYPLHVNKNNLTLAGVSGPTNTAILSGGVMVDNPGVKVTGLQIGESTALGEIFGVYINSGANNVEISYNIIDGNDTNPSRGIVTATNAVTNAVIKHNVITDWLTGIFLNPSVNMLVEHNLLESNGVGSGNDGPSGNAIRYNIIRNNTIEGVGYSDDGQAGTVSLLLNFNNIYGNDAAGNEANIYSGTTPNLNAENNWWGDNTPADEVNDPGRIDTVPFEVSAFPDINNLKKFAILIADEFSPSLCGEEISN